VRSRYERTSLQDLVCVRRFPGHDEAVDADGDSEVSAGPVSIRLGLPTRDAEVDDEQPLPTSQAVTALERRDAGSLHNAGEERADLSGLREDRGTLAELLVLVLRPEDVPQRSEPSVRSSGEEQLTWVPEKVEASKNPANEPDAPHLVRRVHD
jgi:hypothetical protein